MITEVNEQNSPRYPGVSIHEMSLEDRPREKALRHGFGSLTIPELFALILRTGTKGFNVVEICREMMRRNEHRLRVLERRSLEELSDIRGLGESKSIQVMAVLELIRRYGREQLPEHPRIRTSRDFYAVVSPEIANLPHEEIWAGFLDRKNCVTKIYQVSKGGMTASVVDVKMILKAALLERAESIILAHNHPSGNLVPSQQDNDVTCRLSAACRTMEIRMLDHLIVTPRGYYSYADEGKLP